MPGIVKKISLVAIELWNCHEKKSCTTYLHLPPSMGSIIISREKNTGVFSLCCVMKETVAFILCDEHKRSIGNFRGKKAQAKGKNTFLLSATTVWVLVCVTDIVVSQPLVKTWRQQAKKKSSQLVLCYLPLLTHNSSIQAFVFVKTHKKFEKANTIS